MGKGRVVDLHRDKGTGALACAVPASTDFSAGFGIAEQHAPVGCIVAVVRLSRDERHDNIEHEGPDLARETVLRGMKDDDHHGLCSWLVVRSEERRVGRECVSKSRYRWSSYH